MTATTIYTGYAAVAVLFGLWCGSIWKSYGGEWLVGFLMGLVFDIFGLIYVMLVTRGRSSRRPPS
jgi:hypothetical protein